MAKGMIKQNKSNGTWYVKYDYGRDPLTGNRLSTMKRGFPTKKAAQEFLTERLAEVNKGVHINIKSSPKTLEELFFYWLENYAAQNTAPRTYEGYEYIIKGHFIPAMGKIKLADLKPHHIQSYYTNKANEGLSARTILHHHRLLHQILDHAVGWEFVVRNAANAVEPPSPEENEMVALTHEQVDILLEAAQLDEQERMGENQKAIEEGKPPRWSQTDYYSPIFTKVGTGVRRGELLGLKWSDLDLNRSASTAMIQRTVQRVVGRGLITKEPKSKKSRRTIVLMPYVAEHLRKLKIKQAERKLALGPLYQDNELVFCTPDGSLIEPSEFVRVFRRIVTKAVRLSGERGLPSFPENLRLHDLRHTWATNAIKDGMPIKVVSEYLGHSNINITLQTYYHVTHDLQVSAINDLEAKRKERLRKQNTL